RRYQIEMLPTKPQSGGIRPQNPSPSGHALDPPGAPPSQFPNPSPQFSIPNPKVAEKTPKIRRRSSKIPKISRQKTTHDTDATDQGISQELIQSDLVLRSYSVSSVRSVVQQTAFLSGQIQSFPPVPQRFPTNSQSCPKKRQRFPGNSQRFQRFRVATD